MILALLATVSAKTTNAQLPRDPQYRSFDELYERIGGRSTIEMSIAHEKMVRYRAILLHHRMNAFVKAWNQLADITSKGGWDARLARRAAEAFHELERCEGWYSGKTNSSRH